MASVESAGAAGDAAKLVCFFLAGQEYAAPITEVKETMLLRPITRVFLTPPWLAGIINLRGDVVAVIDLARLLGQG
ncbi:MAG TPA: chemotaxis protein CheW, partial [Kofleriaceae bacterium]|nr:chemotaxis protein CheW [Kofleriaceae bacterium]